MLEIINGVPQSANITLDTADTTAIQAADAAALVADYLDHLLLTTDGANNYPNNVTAGTILAKIISKAAAGATPGGFNCTTDSLEAIADAVAAIPTTAMRGTDNAALASVLGALTDAAASGAVTDTDTAMAYIKQLVTAIQLIPTTAMRGTDNAFLASVGGALDSAAATGAVSDAKVAMAYIKQIVNNVDASLYPAGARCVKPKTIDLHQAAASYDLYTCTTQPCVIEGITIQMPAAIDISDDTAITAISIQTDDTTAQTFIPAATAVKASMTAGAQFSWTGFTRIAVGKKVQLTIVGGTADADPTTCLVEVLYHPTVTGGYLA